MAMTRMARTLLVATLLALPLGACATFEDVADPSNWFGDDFFGLIPKKKLQGERKAVFPEGVPGVDRGVPRELVKGNQLQPELAGEQGLPGAQAAIEEEPKPPPKPKAKPKPKPKPATAAVERQPTPVTVRRAPAQAQPAGSGGNDAQWPDPPGTRSAAPGGASGAGTVQWPDPSGARGGSPGGTSGSNAGGVQWPDPPSAR